MGSINVFPFSCLTFLMGDKKTELIKKLKLLIFHERIPFRQKNRCPLLESILVVSYFNSGGLLLV